MIHPLLERKYLLAYLSGFLIFVTLQSFILITVRHEPIPTALTATLAHNFSFFVLGTSIWFVIKYLEPSENKIIKILFTHFATCITVIAFSFILDEIFLKIIIKAFNLDFKLEDLFYMQLIGGFFYYLLIILFYYLIKTIYENKAKSKNETKLKALLKESELNALKSQINPHFLFNSLNSISSLTISDPDKAQEMLIKLSEYLRYSLKQKDNKPVSLTEELDNCKKYLEIEKIRFGDKLQTSFEIELECYSYKLPVLILQPLYENAVKHGVYESMMPVLIETSAYIEDNTMIISLKNDYDNTAIPRKGEGIGISNVETRLELLYNNKAALKTNKQTDTFTARLEIPLH